MTDMLKQEIVDASRILAGLGINDAFGHVSGRTASGTFMMTRAVAPALAKMDDVLELDFDGNLAESPHSTTPPALFLERFIHGEIYRARPDVMAVVHSHSPQVVPFTVIRGKRLKPICHVCGFLDNTNDTFEIADHAGPGSDLLISDTRLGIALARHLGMASVVLMRGHGFTAVGDSVADATYRAVYTARNCEIELAARTLGEPRFLSEQEAAACSASIAGQAGRAWQLWRHQFGTQA